MTPVRLLLVLVAIASAAALYWRARYWRAMRRIVSKARTPS